MIPPLHPQTPTIECARIARRSLQQRSLCLLGSLEPSVLAAEALPCLAPWLLKAPKQSFAIGLTDFPRPPPSPAPPVHPRQVVLYILHCCRYIFVQIDLPIA